ncbi:MAG: tetratricopeptide repeat protein [Candidatus Aminicenantales bacterium]
MKTSEIAFFISVLLVFSSCVSPKKAAPGFEPERRDARFFLLRGTDYLARKEYPKAIEQFRKAVAIDPKSSKAFNLMGIAYFQMMDYPKARGCFEKAVAIQPSYAQAHNNLGSVHFMERNFKEARGEYEKAISLKPDHASAYYSLGYLLFAQGKIEEGTEYLSRGVALDPDFLEKKKDFVTRFSSLAFPSSEIFFAMAEAYAALGDIEKTTKYLEKAREAGFREWGRIKRDAAFDKIRENPRIRAFMKSTASS